MDPHRVKGKTRQVTGKMKEGIGKLAGDSSTEAEGKIDQLTGKLQEGYGKVKDELRAERERQDERHGRDL